VITVTEDSFSDAKSIVEECDAYYGSPSVLAIKFMEQGKPVMIMNVDIK